MLGFTPAGRDLVLLRQRVTSTGGLQLHASRLSGCSCGPGAAKERVMVGRHSTDGLQLHPDSLLARREVYWLLPAHS